MALQLRIMNVLVIHTYNSSYSPSHSVIHSIALVALCVDEFDSSLVLKWIFTGLNTKEHTHSAKVETPSHVPSLCNPSKPFKPFHCS